MADTILPLKIDALLAPIPGDDPRGAEIWRVEFKDPFDAARKEIVSFDKGANSSARPKVEEPGRWGWIINEAQTILTGKTKDLYVAVRLTEALLKHRESGYSPFQGLAEGLKLIRRLVDEAWDRLYPSIEDGDVEVRGTPVNWLDDNERQNNVPLLIKCTPLVGDFWWVDFNPQALTDGRAPDKVAEERRKTANLSAGAAGAKHWGPVAQFLTQGLDEIRLLDEALVLKMGNDLAPSLRNLRNALTDCLDLARSHMPKSAETAPSSTAPVAAASASEAAAAPPTSEKMVTRADIYERLSEAAARLQQIEPHSPIPYLIQRAVDLGQMPFPQLMKALISDAKVIEELNRGLGIKSETPPAK